MPGTEHPLAAYFTRGSGHNDEARYSERSEDYEKLVDRLAWKYEKAKEIVPQPVVEYEDGVEIGLMAYGSTDIPMSECRDQLSKEYGVTFNYLRIRALPFTHHVQEFVSRCERVYVVEQNRDGQMADLVRLEVGEDQNKIRTILHYKGLPVDARFITDHVMAHEKGEKS